MAQLSKEVRLLQNKWLSGQSFPKRLEWIEIDGLRGWSNQRIELAFPITALVGENGVGKSTVLQAIASSYQSRTNYFASDFFPNTTWETVKAATIRTSVREGITSSSTIASVRKPTNKWRGNPDRPVRSVVYIDLRRIQPILARFGYGRLANPQLKEESTDAFDTSTLNRLSNVMGRRYELAKLSITDIDKNRPIPVLQRDGAAFSGFHQGAGEVAMAELIKQPFPKYSIVLIDEIETSLHPRVQRRLLRDIANLCREHELQVVLTTHSPYILAELPAEARVYIVEGAQGKQIITGVSPEFAMTKMDEAQHPEADIFVEDARSAGMLREIIVSRDKDLISRVQIIPFGAASAGRILGIMARQQRFPRPTVVFLDGDQVPSDGCLNLPGGDAPERVIFEELNEQDWGGVPRRVGRPVSDVIDCCSSAMTLSSHHEWVKSAADRLALGGDVLWQAICAEWAEACLNPDEAQGIVDSISEVMPA
jgi:predicted ATPase